MDRFVDRVAIVTGAAQGIGADTAIRLAAEGATVAVVDLTAERSAGTAERIARSGGRAIGFACNVTQTEEVRSLVAEVIQRLAVSMSW